MPKTPVADQIQKFLDQRKLHVDALASIDAVLARVSHALASNGEAASPSAKPAGKKRRRRMKFATTANEFVLAFIKANKNPTSQELQKHWISQGRPGAVANTLSVLTKAKQLKRVPLGKGIKGSRYSLS